MSLHPVSAGLLDRLPPAGVLTSPEQFGRLLHDEAEWAPYGRPLAAVLPTSTAEVAAAVEVCAALGVPVVPRGAGTGLSGGANAVDGCVIVGTERMDRILSVDAANQTATVQAGVVNDRLKKACEQAGLWYPPDPASSAWSTIGGNVATNAGGLCCLKYGVTRDYVLALTAVTADGALAELGHRTTKGVAGYDLCSLFTGSEGTLGIITEVTVRLRPRPAAHPVTAVGFSDRLPDAGQAVAAVAADGIEPAVFELVDRHCLQAVDSWKRMGLDPRAAVLLLARSDLPGAAGQAEGERVVELFTRNGATWAGVSTDEQEAEALFAARRLAYPALERLGPVLTEDICVPRSALPDMLARVESLARRHRTPVANIAHAGDGNLHPLLLAPAGDSEARARAERLFDGLLDAALALGGTVTGEHGVGLLKRDGMRKEHSPVVLGMQRAVKDALDPAGLFNPGKAL